MKKITLLAFVLTIGLATGCKDEFLDVAPKAVLGASNFYNRVGVG